MMPGFQSNNKQRIPNILRNNSQLMPDADTEQETNTAVSHLAYGAATGVELSFEKGDHFTILEKKDGWYYATLMRTGQTGYIPISHITLQESSSKVNLSEEDDRTYSEISSTSLENPDERTCSEISFTSSEEQADNNHTYCNVAKIQDVLVAIYDFKGNTEQELSFLKGDKFRLIKKGDDWHTVIDLKTNKQGLVPFNYVFVEGSPDIQDWYFGDASRADCTKMLMSRTNTRGAFMIRRNQRLAGAYSLSIRDWNDNDKDHVKHYLIKYDDVSRRYYIKEETPFQSLQELVDFYKENLHHISHKLSEPCPKVVPTAHDQAKEETNDDWEVSKNDLTWLQDINRGHFGTVGKGVWNAPSGSFDVMIKNLNHEDPNAMNKFKREAEILKSLRHKHLVILYAVCTKEKPHCLVIEYMPNGDLKNYLKNKSTPFQRKGVNLISIASQVADAMSFLEDNKIIHMDLAARNVFVGESNVVKVSNLGLARYLSETKDRQTKVAVKWVASELFILGTAPTHKSDVWSYGILLYELFTFGADPYPGMSNDQVRKIIQRPTLYRMEKPNDFPNTVYDLMVQCWDPIPEKRPSFPEIFKFFQNLPKENEATNLHIRGTNSGGQVQINNSIIGGKTNDIVVAIFDFKGVKDELSFQKGDKFRITEQREDWHTAIHLKTKKKGFIPSNYVCFEESSEIQDWFFGDTSRADSEDMLIHRTKIRGAFLIRTSRKWTGAFSLSVRDWSHNERDHVKHYLIKYDDANCRYYLKEEVMLESLVELVAYYKENLKHLCHQLTVPCPKEKPAMLDLSKETTDNWEIPKGELVWVQEISQGNFGTVWKGLWNHKTDVAIKSLKSEDTLGKAEFKKEAGIMKKIRHKHLVSLYGVCTREEPLYLVMEFMSNGNLKSYLKRKSSRLQERDVNLISMASQIADAMTYLEENKIIHLDLAARNILVGESNVVKVSDFGHSRNLSESDALPKVAIKWLAPELFIPGAKATHKCDVWSYGVLLYEIFTYGNDPYPDKSNDQVRKLIQKPTNYRLDKPNDCPPRIYNLMIHCWDSEPEKRHTFSQIFDFFEEYSDLFCYEGAVS